MHMHAPDMSSPLTARNIAFAISQENKPVRSQRYVGCVCVWLLAMLCVVIIDLENFHSHFVVQLLGVVDTSRMLQRVPAYVNLHLHS